MRKERQFDAFISYAHEQQDVAIWLHRLLERYWVPGYGGRRVFLDREHLSAEKLSPMIHGALDHSRSLIVLCSKDSRGSEWVSPEVEYFVAKHGIDRVYAARVGTNGDREVPIALTRVAALEGKLVPCLYGQVSTWNATTRHEREQAGLALLGSILGQDKSRITARRERFWRISGSVVAALACSVLVWSGWLYGTEDGGFRRLAAKLESDAGLQRADDPQLVYAAFAAGRIGDAELIEALAVSAAEPATANQLRLAGAAGADESCEAVAQLYQLIDQAAVRAAPDSALLAGRRCKIDMPTELASQRLSAALDTGRDDQVVAMLGAKELEPRERLQIAALLDALGITPESAEHPWRQALRNDLGQMHPADRAAAVADLATHYFDRKQGASMVFAGLLTYAAEGLLGMNELGELEWSEGNRLAAFAMLNGQSDLTQRLREAISGMDDSMAGLPQCHAEGLAFAALADSVLNPERSKMRLHQAKICGSAELPMSKTWREWHIIARALYAQGRWQEALVLPAQVSDTSARMRLSADLLNRFVESRCRRRALVWTPWPRRVGNCHSPPVPANRSIEVH